MKISSYQVNISTRHSLTIRSSMQLGYYKLKTLPFGVVFLPLVNLGIGVETEGIKNNACRRA